MEALQGFLLDWVAKIRDSISPTKLAFTILGTLCLLVAFWQQASEILSERGIPDDYTNYFLIVLALSISYLVVELFCIVRRKIVSMQNDRKARKKRKSDQACYEQKVRTLLPHLPPSELSVLRDLVNSEQLMEGKRKGVQQLIKRRWIKKAAQVSATEFIFQINTVIRPIFIEFEEHQIKEKVNQAISKLTESQREFLNLFWLESIAHGTRESQSIMPFEIYHAGLELVTLQVLSKSELSEGKQMYERFSLTEYTSSRLENEIFAIPPARTEADLSLSYVEGSRASGGGAPGGGLTANNLARFL